MKHQSHGPERADGVGIFEKRWYAYALAGAGAIAAAPHAKASVILLPPSSVLNNPASCTGTTCGPVSLTVDLDSSGTDFSIAAALVSSIGGFTFTGQNNTSPFAAILTSNGGLNVPALAFGTAIGPGGSFNAGVPSPVTFAPSSRWANTTGYFGFEFVCTATATCSNVGQTNYGWAQLTTVTTFDSISATIDEVAYESQSGVAINAGNTGITPEPATEGVMLVALLAMGAAGLAASRKRKQALNIATTRR